MQKPQKKFKKLLFTRKICRFCSFLLTSEEKEPKKTATPKPLQRGFSLFRGKTLSIKVLVWLAKPVPYRASHGIGDYAWRVAFGDRPIKTSHARALMPRRTLMKERRVGAVASLPWGRALGGWCFLLVLFFCAKRKGQFFWFFSKRTSFDDERKRKV